MKLKPYPEYKDSGVEFIEHIPKEWNISRVKNIVDHSIYYPVGDGDHGQITPEMYQNSGIPYIRVQNLSWGFEINDKGLVYLSEEVNNANRKSILRPKDILIAKTGATVGKLGIIPNSMNQANTTSSVGKITVDHAKNNYKFLAYLLLSNITKNQIDMISSQKSAQPGFNIDDLVEFKVLVPPINEQNQIVSFLDKKTSEIDLTIKKDTRLIELLREKRTALINHVVTKGLDPTAEMKDSGVEWIGEIPEDWEVNKIKEITDVKISNVDKKSKENEPEVLLCNYTDVYNNEFITSKLDFMKATASVEQVKKLSLRKGDVIITKDSETQEDIAVPALVNEDLENVVCGYHLALIRPHNNEIIGDFLFRLLQSRKINDQFVIAANGVTRFGISTYPIKNSYLTLPPLDQQELICKYLNHQSSKIDLTIEKIGNNIELLDEYKKSLIHHVVTGKVDVREVAV